MSEKATYKATHGEFICSEDNPLDELGEVKLDARQDSTFEELRLNPEVRCGSLFINEENVYVSLAEATLKLRRSNCRIPAGRRADDMPKREPVIVSRNATHSKSRSSKLGGRLSLKLWSKAPVPDVGAEAEVGGAIESSQKNEAKVATQVAVKVAQNESGDKWRMKETVDGVVLQGRVLGDEEIVSIVPTDVSKPYSVCAELVVEHSQLRFSHQRPTNANDPRWVLFREQDKRRQALIDILIAKTYLSMDSKNQVLLGSAEIRSGRAKG